LREIKNRNKTIPFKTFSIPPPLKWGGGREKEMEEMAKGLEGGGRPPLLPTIMLEKISNHQTKLVA
jgi:hypothetical protein